MERLRNGDYIIRRDDEVLVGFAGKRSVICTSPLGGGIRKELRAVFNHCDLDPETRFCKMHGKTYKEHLSYIAERAGLNPKYCAGLSTACRMDTMRIAQIIEHGIEVTLLLTGGINKNGRCAGDPTTMWEEGGIFTVIPEEHDISIKYPEEPEEFLDPPTDEEEPNFLDEEDGVIPEPGTINIILHIDAALSQGALAGAIMLITEAKNAALRELQVESCYSDDYATGSGTDGIIVIANADSKRKLTQIRTDTRMGEVISLLIRETLTDCIVQSMQEEDEGYIEEE